jgi:hypothetical protein
MPHSRPTSATRWLARSSDDPAISIVDCAVRDRVRVPSAVEFCCVSRGTAARRRGEGAFVVRRRSATDRRGRGYSCYRAAPTKAQAYNQAPIPALASKEEQRPDTMVRPYGVAATIGVTIDQVTEVIKRHRNSGAPVEGTSANELQVALRHFGYDLALVTDFAGNPLPPTFAAWERAQIDMDAAFIVEVTFHWVAYRGGVPSRSWWRIEVALSPA